MKFGCYLLSLLLAAVTGSADVKLAPLFRDGAVLQRDVPLTVWGRADEGETVEVSFNGQSRSTVAGREGDWRVTLGAEPASAVPKDLRVRGRNALRVANILVGDVWLCSGQSNMEWPVSGALDAEREIAAAQYPLIRQFKLPRAVAADPAFDTPGAWQECTPKTAGQFSAVAYFFAREVFKKSGVPVGIINSSYGGTVIEPWISVETLKRLPVYPVILSHWENVLAAYPAKLAQYEADLAQWREAVLAAKNSKIETSPREPLAPEGPGSRWMPGGIYNAMIHPLVPYALSGVLWYQGEGNGDRANGSTGHQEYRTLFPALITQWRTAFDQGDLPFYFVQIANCIRKGDPTEREWAFLREAQSRALALPHTGMVVTIDIGEARAIHPPNKQEVGRRLAKQVAAQRGATDASSGPVFAGAVPAGNALRLNFRSANGLHLSDQGSGEFELSGPDRRFFPARARVEGDSVLVASDSVKAPVSVRYAWSNAPTASLFNGAGLPAAPFRSDDW